jgi:transcriptional regulator with XRE-family HTH domain
MGFKKISKDEIKFNQIKNSIQSKDVNLDQFAALTLVKKPSSLANLAGKEVLAAEEILLPREQVYRNIRDNLVFLLEKHGHSVQSLADFTGQKELAISRVLAGFNSADPHLLYNIAHYFDYDLGNLVTLDPEQLAKLPVKEAKTFYTPLKRNQLHNNYLDNIYRILVSHQFYCKRITKYIFSTGVLLIPDVR